jgi:hypothetical protein
MTVVTIVSDYDVGVADGGDCSNGTCFLASIEVQEASYLVLGIHLCGPVLERANEDHLVEEFQRGLSAERSDTRLRGSVTD